MFCSTIIPTIGRPSLNKAVDSILSQDFQGDEFEVIVVNDSGKPLPDAEWQKSERVTVIHTNRHNRSVARNTGAAVARGRYLHFLDDDDWMLPGVFNSFWNAASGSESAWIYGAFRLVNNAGMLVTEIVPEEVGNCAIQMLAWEWLPLQASFIRADAFFRVGGFASLESLLGGFEDIDLSRQISLSYDMARLDEIVTVIRIGEASSTTDYLGMFMQNRQSRERTLSTPGAFRRLVDSATASPRRASYWRGKVIYYFLASMKWNAGHARITAAVNRLFYSVLGLLLSARHLFARDFWLGVFKPHYPRMGTALQEAGADHLYSETRRKIEEAQGWTKR